LWATGREIAGFDLCNVISAAPLIGGDLANRFDPNAPFLAYAPLLLVSAFCWLWWGKNPGTLSGVLL
jgi:hypothetical protein